MINKLILIGYWHNRDNPHYPDPAWFVDETWGINERNKVIAHLQTATYMPYACGGGSWCRFRCGEKSVGSRELTDGVYVWPEGYIHYVQLHQVKPPQQFIDHVLSYTSPSFSIENCNVDIAWWLQQAGFNRILFTANHPTDYGLLEIVPEAIKPFFMQKVRDVLWAFLYPTIGYKKTEQAIAEVLEGKTTSIAGEFVPFETISSECKRLGVKLSFTLLE